MSDAERLRQKHEADARLRAKIEENLRKFPDNPALNYELGRYDGWMAAVKFLEKGT